MRVVIAAGLTRTARIEGISAAGADPEAAVHTPGADLEIVAFGRPVRAPVVPVSPTGCPTPAVVTRAVRETAGFDLLAVDAGLSAPTAAPTVDVDAAPGADVREARPVPDAAGIVDAASEVGAGLPDDDLLVGETIPGGTTTALGVLAALGEPYGVSSSLPENPIERKRAVVAKGLAESGLERGGAAGDPEAALASMGDPVLAAVFGLVRGAAASGTGVTLAGGTQMVAAATLLRHAGVDAPLGLATTPFVAQDGSADLRDAAAELGLDLAVTDPGFDRGEHPAFGRYLRGEAKEGVGMGGALALAEGRGIPMADVRARVASLTDALTEGGDGS
ncbi:MAG: nicotinate-nucleotide--dimethylbenzimidazole phosphoribosyltransferase [Halobacteriales archaeon]